MDLEENLPKKKPQIVVGEPLDMLSLSELAQRIEALDSEIARTREVIAQKQAGKSAADAFFKR